jgi:hypothetical protein
MMSLLLGLLFLITAVIHTRYWKQYRPKNMTVNVERAFTTGSFTGLGASCITGVWVIFGWELLITAVVLLIILNISFRLLMEY